MLLNKMRKTNVKGFSLVELMVVVAIIGILAAVAIPNFQRFQRKARQSEAKTLLGGIHSAEAAFHGQWENYSTDFQGVGWAPDGTLRYIAGFAAAVPWSDMVPTDYPGVALTGNSFNTAQMGVCGAGTMCVNGSGIAAPTSVMAPAGFGNVATFQAGADGRIGGAVNDVWNINQQKTFTNVTDGTL